MRMSDELRVVILVANILGGMFGIGTYTAGVMKDSELENRIRILETKAQRAELDTRPAKPIRGPRNQQVAPQDTRASDTQIQASVSPHESTAISESRRARTQTQPKTRSLGGGIGAYQAIFQRGNENSRP